MAGQSSSSNLSSANGNSTRFMLVKDLEPNLKNFNMCVIVLEIGKPTQTKDGIINHFEFFLSTLR
jgi:hypothetical protein